MNRLPALVISAALGVGFGYATLGMLSLLGTYRLGYRLWWLELIVAAGFGAISYALFERSAGRQRRDPITSRGERAIWRLAYRRGMELELRQIVAETLLDEGSALAALRELERRGEAVALEGNRWRLISG